MKQVVGVLVIGFVLLVIGGVGQFQVLSEKLEETNSRISVNENRDYFFKVYFPEVGNGTEAIDKLVKERDDIKPRITWMAGTGVALLNSLTKVNKEELEKELGIKINFNTPLTNQNTNKEETKNESK